MSNDALRLSTQATVRGMLRDGTLTPRVENLFNDNQFRVERRTENFYQDAEFRWGTREVSLSLQYTIGTTPEKPDEQ